MLFRDPFRLRSTLSESSSADGEDTLKTKKALKSMGYYRTPSFGLTDFPDGEMFTGIKRFQRDKALSVDGIMRPGGETERAVGYGVDLGQMSGTELQRLGDQYDLPQGLIDRLKPYTSKSRDEAQAFLKANPLTITDQEAKQLSMAKYKDTMEKLRGNVAKHLGSADAWDKLSDQEKTVIYSLSINFGPHFLDTHKNFRGHLQNRSLDGMISELRNYGGQKALEGRRNIEADILEKLKQSLQR